MTSLLLNGEVKEDATRELPRQQESLYASAASSDNLMKLDAGTGRRYYDLNAANRVYRGAWLFGQEHIQMFIGPLKAQWDQWCPVPADIPDGVLIKGTVVYEQAGGSWNRSADEFEGVLRTMGGVRYFVGKTQHTFTGRNIPNGMMKVVANLNVKLTGSASSNPLIPVRRQSQPYAVGGPGGPATYSPYARNSGEQAPAYQPAYQQPSDQQPAQQPTYQQPNYQQSQPSYQQPSYTQWAPQQPAYGAGNANPDFLNPSGSSSPQPGYGYGTPSGQPGYGQPGGYAPAVRQPAPSNDPDPAGF